MVGNCLVCAGQEGHSCLPRQPPGEQLVAHLLHYFGARADESDSGILALAGETGVFRQETVAGVNRVGPGELGGSQNLADIEVAF